MASLKVSEDEFNMNMKKGIQRQTQQGRGSEIAWLSV